MRARAPASSANLGPGFDTLAVALSCYVEVQVEPADRFGMATEGEGADLPQDQTHLAARIVTEILGHDRAHVAVRSDIPVARGLGSSAALAAAAAAAAGADRDEAFAVATRIDGHAENAAASVFGGLVTATLVEGRPLAHRLPLDDDVVFVALVPDRPLPTVEARRALPDVIAHDAAVDNLGRMGLLIAGLADRTFLVPAATEDRLHQPYRSALFPEADKLISGLVDAGALAGCWSGAGPTLLAICSRQEGKRVRAVGGDLLDRAGVAGRALLLEADREGLRVDV